MDVKIENRDTATTSAGELCYVDCDKELCQRIRIACEVRKGDFVYDRQLGCNHMEIDFNDDRLNDRLCMLFKEATVDIPYTDLRVTKVYRENDMLKAKLEITSGEEILNTEVSINEQL